MRALPPSERRVKGRYVGKEVLARFNAEKALAAEQAQQSQQQGPAEPTEQGPAKPTEQGPAEPTEQSPAEPTEQGPAEPTEQSPAEPTEQSPAGPTDTQRVSTDEDFCEEQDES